MKKNTKELKTKTSKKPKGKPGKSVATLENEVRELQNRLQTAQAEKGRLMDKLVTTTRARIRLEAAIVAGFVAKHLGEGNTFAKFEADWFLADPDWAKKEGGLPINMAHVVRSGADARSTK